VTSIQNTEDNEESPMDSETGSEMNDAGRLVAGESLSP
jgi:hypothetical protein